MSFTSNGASSGYVHIISLGQYACGVPGADVALVFTAQCYRLFLALRA